MKAGLLYKISFLVIIISSCAHNPFDGKRSISSDSEKYFLTNEAALKRIKDLKVNPLTDSQCFADPESKIYLSNVKQTATSNFKDLKSQINVDSMENTSTTEYYFCKVTCLLNNRYAAFWTKLTDSPNRHENDNAFICQGISMEMVNIPGTSLQTLGAVVKNISAFDLKELLPRLKEVNYKMSPQAKAELDSKAFKNFAIIGKAYVSSTLPAMIEAGKILEQIAAQKPGSKAVLDKYLLKLKDNKGQLKADFSTDYFVMLNIIQNGSHLIYDKI